MPAEEWEQLDSELAFDNEWFRVRSDTVRLPSGRVQSGYLVGVLADYALVAAVTRDRRAVLVRQWKQGVRRLTLELPGGAIEEGETAAEAAARELREETGYVGSGVEHLASLDVDASKSANQGHVFLARDAELLARPEPHEMEDPEIVLIELEAVRTLIERGEIQGAASVVGLLLTLERLQ